MKARDGYDRVTLTGARLTRVWLSAYFTHFLYAMHVCGMCIYSIMISTQTNMSR